VRRTTRCVACAGGPPLTPQDRAFKAKQKEEAAAKKAAIEKLQGGKKKK